VIWICTVVVFEGFIVLTHLKVRDWALEGRSRDELGEPLDGKPRTPHLRSQPPQAPNSRGLRVKGLLGCLVAIIRHVGSRLNPGGGIVQFGAPGREFTEGANTKARNAMCAGVGSTGPVSRSESFDRPLGTCRGARVVFVVKGLRSLDVFIVGLPGAFIDGLN